MPAVPGPVPFNAQNAGPALDGFAIVPSDTTNQNSMWRSLYVGGPGNLTLITSQGNALIFLGVPAGTILPIAGVRVNAGGLTASALVGLL